MKPSPFLVKCFAVAVLSAVPVMLASGQAPLSFAIPQPHSAAPAWPDAPQPELPFGQTAAQEASAVQGASASQNQSAEPSSEKTRHQTAEQQIQEQQKQRVLGVLPMFNTSYVRNAVPLTGAQKMKLAFRSSIDPMVFAGAAVVAGLGEINGSDNNDGFGWGADGFAKRWGAVYLDAFGGTMIGNGILPAILRQDPRYFRLGRGRTTRRMLYAVASAVICKHDNGRLEPNYSNVGGNFAAGALSNLYYPSKSGRSEWDQTFSSAMIVTATGAVGSVFQEFWPDISRKLFKKDPTRGLDDQVRADDAAAKAANQQNKTEQPLQPAPK